MSSPLPQNLTTANHRGLLICSGFSVSSYFAHVIFSEFQEIRAGYRWNKIKAEIRLQENVKMRLPFFTVRY